MPYSDNITEEDKEKHYYYIRENLLKSDSPEEMKNYVGISSESQSGSTGEMVASVLYDNSPGVSSRSLGSFNLFVTVAGANYDLFGEQRMLVEALADTIGVIEAVERIYVVEENGVKQIYTIINDNDLVVKNTIYETEIDILDEFPDDRLEFHVIWRENRNIEDTISFPMDPIFVR